MSRIAVIGKEEFVLGFRLAGIRDTFVTGSDPWKDIQHVRQKEGLAIVVIDQDVMNSLQQHDRNEIEDSISPVFVHLGTKSDQGSIRRLIKKSIGVDIWDMERG